jgi:uncharacterized damage-inducible protein DinB
MGEVERIADQLRRAFEGDAWHGPSLMELIAEVGPDRAARRAVAGAHNIREIVLHIAAWEDVVRRRIEGERIVDLPPEEDWPAAAGDGPEAWDRDRRLLEDGHRRLAEAAGRLTEQRLGETVPGATYTFYAMLHGVIQHDLYHAGQIAVLGKA